MSWPTLTSERCLERRKLGIFVSFGLAFSAGCHGATEDDDTAPHHSATTDTTGSPTGETGGTGGDHTGTIVERTPEEILTEAFYWGYPLVLSTRSVSDHDSYNTFRWKLDRPDYRNRGAVVPNPDVLYSTAVMDLRAEPLVVHTPEILDRYWSVQFADFWVETVGYVGTRATGGVSGDYLVTAPGWKGTVPKGMVQIASPTAQLITVSRLHVNSDADVPTADALAGQFEMRPLSSVLGTTPPDPAERSLILEEPYDTGENGIVFWDELGYALEANPPRAEDEALVAGLAALGVGPGLRPSTDTTLDPSIRALLESLPGALVPGIQAGVEYDDWKPMVSHVGNFYGDYERRAIVCYDAWISNRPEEATYAVSPRYSENRVLHFDASELPPVGAFWSVTLYGDDRYMVQNTLNQYSVQSSDPLVEYNQDGSLDIWFQRDGELAVLSGTNRYNVVPAPPTGPYYLMMRMYLPSTPVVDGTYAPPEAAPSGL